MVPVKGTKYVHLEVQGATISSVEPANSNIASIRTPAANEVLERYKSVYALDGKLKGTTFIIAKQGKTELARLERGVKDARPVSIQAFLISDNAGHVTPTSEANVKEWVAEASEILEPQTNVVLTLKSVAKKKIDLDLGAPRLISDRAG